MAVTIEWNHFIKFETDMPFDGWKNEKKAIIFCFCTIVVLFPFIFWKPRILIKVFWGNIKWYSWEYYQGVDMYKAHFKIPEL